MPFSTTDVRGFYFYFPDERVSHVEDKHPEIRGKWDAVERTIVSPDGIRGNPQTPFGLPERVAQERYYRFDTTFRRHIVVVARVGLTGAEYAHGYRPDETHRIGWTVYLSFDPPKGGEVRWDCSRANVYFRGGT